MNTFTFEETNLICCYRRAQLAQDRETVKAAPKKQAAKTKNKGLEV